VDKIAQALVAGTHRVTNPKLQPWSMADDYFSGEKQRDGRS
jgi:hypothetical protein